MELISRVIILAACVLTAYSWPTHYDVFQGRAQDKCSAEFQQNQQTINAEISIQTGRCVEATAALNNKTLKFYAPQADNSRRNLTQLEFNLNNCTAIQDTLYYVACVTANDQKNENLLNTGNDIAENVQVNVENAFENAQDRQENCIDNVLETASKNFTKASDEFRKCKANSVDLKLNL